MLLLTHCDWPSTWAKRTLPPFWRAGGGSGSPVLVVQNRPFWRAVTIKTDEGVTKPAPACCCIAAVVPPLSRAGATPGMRQLRRSSAARHGAAGLRLA
jgi:hypothetical protein